MLAVCVMMQLAAMLPHHHHGDSEALCVGYFDAGCGEDNCGNHECGSCGCSGAAAPAHDGACCGSGAEPYGHVHDGHAHHGHGHTPAVCNVHTLVITQPEREDIVLVAGAVDIHEDLGGAFRAQAEEQFMAVRATALFDLEFRRRPDAEPLLTGYISVARPPRGPDMVA